MEESLVTCPEEGPPNRAAENGRDFVAGDLDPAVEEFRIMSPELPDGGGSEQSGQDGGEADTTSAQRFGVADAVAKAGFSAVEPGPGGAGGIVGEVGPAAGEVFVEIPEDVDVLQGPSVRGAEVAHGAPGEPGESRVGKETDVRPETADASGHVVGIGDEGVVVREVAGNIRGSVPELFEVPALASGDGIEDFPEAGARLRRHRGKQLQTIGRAPEEFLFPGAGDEGPEGGGEIGGEGSGIGFGGGGEETIPQRGEPEAAEGDGSVRDIRHGVGESGQKVAEAARSAHPGGKEAQGKVEGAGHVAQDRIGHFGGERACAGRENPETHGRQVEGDE